MRDRPRPQLNPIATIPKSHARRHLSPPADSWRVPASRGLQDETSELASARDSARPSQSRPFAGGVSSENATCNLSENPLTPARRLSIDGLLNQRNRVFG